MKDGAVSKVGFRDMSLDSVLLLRFQMCLRGHGGVGRQSWKGEA
jgi:hypothetical protein